MASVKIIGREDKTNQAELMPLYMRITNKRRKAYLSLDVKLKPKQWNEAKQKVRKNHPNSMRINSLLATKKAKVQKEILKLSEENPDFHPRTVKKRLLNKNNSNSFFDFAETLLNRVYERNSYGYYKKVKGVISKFSRYFDTGQNFKDITIKTIKNYEQYLRVELENSDQTIRTNMKVLRKICNEAEKEGLLSAQDNSFRKYTLPSANSDRTYLDDEELGRLEELELHEYSLLNHVRNAYVFACYAGGIRVSDLLQLKWDNFDGSHLHLQMQKTNDTISIKVPDKALEILEFYKPSEEKNGQPIFPFLQQKDFSDRIKLYNAISNNTALINKYLKKLAKKADIDKNITFHTSRHTFATRALRKGMRIEYVSKILGHHDITVTQQYTKIVNRDLDEAMEILNE